MSGIGLVKAIWTAVFVALLALPAGAQGDAGYAAYQQGDYVTAYRHWQTMADEGDAAAQFNLGHLFHHGLGVEANYDFAVHWYARAAEKGDLDAQRTLGDLYRETFEDPGTAAQWYRLAAQNGDAESQRKLGIMFAGGIGVPQDHTKAAEWLYRAAQQGDEEAQDLLGGLPSSTDDEQEVASVNPQALGLPCPGSPDIPFDVSLQVDIPQATLDHSKSIAELGRMALHSGRGRILGLASTGLSLKPDIEYRARPYGNAYCFWVDKIHMMLSYPRPDMYVASEYRPGSCPFREVLNHEKDHVRTSRRVLRTYATRIRSALNSPSIPSGIQPVIVDSPAQAKAEVKALMKRLVGPVYNAMIKELRREQSILDSPQNYRAINRLCKNW